MRCADADISGQTELGRQRTQMAISRSDAAMGGIDSSGGCPNQTDLGHLSREQLRLGSDPGAFRDQSSQALFTSWDSEVPCALHPDSRLERNWEKEI